ncbi:hypothetical protein BH11MYX3_BH11MYX3_23330 [soil metagenome]
MFAGALVALAGAGLAIVIVWPALTGLVLLALYCVPANSILPIPHEPVVLAVSGMYPPLLVAIAATVGSVVASISDYAVVETALRSPRIDQARDRGVVGWAIRQLRHAPFLIIMAFSAIPLLPISVVRALAPASGYPFRRYLLAGMIGRFPRFYALAYLGAAVEIPTWALVLVTVVTVGVAIASSHAASRNQGEQPVDHDKE